MRNEISERGNDGIRSNEHHGRRQAHAEAVGAAGGDRHGRAQTEQLGKNDIVVPQAVRHDLSIVLSHVTFLPGSPDDGRHKTRGRP